MFSIIDKEKELITLKMDKETYNALKSDIKEDINNYEFIFDEPVSAFDLIKS